MKMPNVVVAFFEKGITAIERSQRGIAALVLKEAKPASFDSKYNIYTPDDIPAGLSDANKNYIELCLMGYQTAPKKVVVLVQDAAAADYTDIFKALENTRFDWLAIPDLKAEDAQIVANWIKGMRDNKDIKVKAVLANTAADSDGIVNFTNTTLKTKDGKVYTAQQYTARVVGIICGTPQKISCTYAPATDLVEVEGYTKEEMDSKVNKGEFFFYFDGEKIKVARGINSFVTTMEDKGNSFKKIKLVDLMDAIHDDIKKTGQESYIGKYSNSYDNRCLLISAIQGYFDSLELSGLLEKGQNSVAIDLTATKVWLESNGKYSKDELANMTDMQVKLANVGDNCFLTAQISPLDALENICLNVHF